MLKLILTHLFIFITILSLTQTRDTFNISGAIISNVPLNLIPGAMIKCANKKVYLADSTGKFTINKLATGLHTLTFTGAGFPAKDTAININGNNITGFIWPVNVNCNGQYNRQKALSDIENKKAALLVVGGFAPTIYSTDKDFEEKYNVGYAISGCLAFDTDECMTLYNRTIFEYLDRNFGKKWRRRVRKDVVGLKNH